jgi:hypothetical protein
MNKETAIIHLLQLIQVCKHTVHWQIAARVGLASLFIDARITRKIRDEVSSLISDATLLNYDHLLS